MPLRLLTAGESHGPVQLAIIDGMPAGLPLAAVDLDGLLRRRQLGHGRGARMKIERDCAQIRSGVRNGLTTGGPITLEIANAEFDNWRLSMGPDPVKDEDTDRWEAIASKRISRLRPGHADFSGAVKYAHSDIRDVLERASARETVARVAAGAVAAILLQQVEIDITSHVVSIGGICARPSFSNITDLRRQAEASPVRCADAGASSAMVALIDKTGKQGDSLGGVVEVLALGVPIGLGSYAQWDKRLDGRIAQAIMSIPAVKGVELGLGFGAAEFRGSEVHDHFLPGFKRPTNNAGGLEGGISNGQPIVVRMAMKPISTLRKPLPSLTWPDGAPTFAHFERADVCAVPAAGVIAEAMLAWVLADVLLEKIGGDSLAELRRHFNVTLADQLHRQGESWPSAVDDSREILEDTAE